MDIEESACQSRGSDSRKARASADVAHYPSTLRFVLVHLLDDSESARREEGGAESNQKPPTQPHVVVGGQDEKQLREREREKPKCE